METSAAVMCCGRQTWCKENTVVECPACEKKYSLMEDPDTKCISLHEVVEYKCSHCKTKTIAIKDRITKCSTRGCGLYFLNGKYIHFGLIRKLLQRIISRYS